MSCLAPFWITLVLGIIASFSRVSFGFPARVALPIHNSDSYRLRRQSHPLFALKKPTQNDETLPEDYFVRRALLVDMGEAARILTDGFFKDRTNFITYQIERLNTYLSLESTFPKEGDEHSIFVACQCTDGKVLAIAEVDGRAQTNTTSTPRPYMCNLAVDTKWRRRGLARSLVVACEEEVREEWNKDILSLKVRETNVGAVEMYKKLGYCVNGNVSDTKTKEIQLLMQKKLPPKRQEEKAEPTKQSLVESTMG